MYEQNAFSYLEDLYEFGTKDYDDLEPVELDKVSALIIKELQREHEFDDHEFLSLIYNSNDFPGNIIGMLLNDKYSNVEKNIDYTTSVLNNIKEGCHSYSKEMIEKYFNLIKENKGFFEKPDEDFLGDAYQCKLNEYRQNVRDLRDMENAA